MITLEAFDKQHFRTTLAAYVPLLIAFAIPFPIRVFTPIAIFCFSFVAVNYGFKRTLRWQVFTTPLFVIGACMFALLIIGLAYTSNTRAGKIDLERSVMLIVMPFVIFQWKNENIKTKDLVLAFLLGTIGLTIYAFGYAFITMDAVELNDMFVNGHSYYTSHISLHPTYLGTFLVFIFFFSIEHIRKNGNKLSKHQLTWWILGILYVLGLIIFIRARISLFILLITFVPYLVLSLPSLRSRLILLSLLVVAGFSAIWLTDLQNISSGFGRNAFWAFGDRLAIWKSAWQGYLMSPIIGGGTGGEQFLIDEGFLKTGYDYGLDNRYNAHNQYLQNLCRNGILDLALLLVLIVYSYRKALIGQRKLFVVFMLIVTLTMLTETFLGKQKGVAFFFFFLSAYIYLDDE